VQEIAAAMRGYAELGMRHIMFQCEPYTSEARKRLTQAFNSIAVPSSSKNAAARPSS
jgi:hypothetical protein